MALARVLQLVDAQVALIRSTWEASASPMAEDDVVERAVVPTISFTADAPAQISGRHVLMFPGPYSVTPFTRDDQWRHYQTRALIVEQYTDAPGPPPDSWIDERTNFVEQVIFNVLANPGLLLLGAFFPSLEEEAAIDLLYDADLLLGNKAFWCVASFPFQENTDWSGGSES